MNIGLLLAWLDASSKIVHASYMHTLVADQAYVGKAGSFAVFAGESHIWV